MNFHTRKWVKPEDLNPNGTLFGGRLLAWIDEEAAIYAIVQLGTSRVVTKFMSEINFVSSARQGDIIELGITASDFGRTSISLCVEIRNKITRERILTIDRIVLVSVDADFKPVPHERTRITYIEDRFREQPGTNDSQDESIPQKATRRRAESTSTVEMPPTGTDTQSNS